MQVVAIASNANNCFAICQMLRNQFAKHQFMAQVTKPLLITRDIILMRKVIAA